MLLPGLARWPLARPLSGFAAGESKQAEVNAQQLPKGQRGIELVQFIETALKPIHRIRLANIGVSDQTINDRLDVRSQLVTWRLAIVVPRGWRRTSGHPGVGGQ